MAASKQMAQALRLAAHARYATSPNPMVGAIVQSRTGRVVGEGYHRRAGADHAEVVALTAAGGAAKGGTLYVTLEPCSHQGRTPPCVDAVVAAGITRVVAAIKDPDPRVNGRGFTRLRRAGVTVEVGDGAAEATELNRRYLAARRGRRVYLALKYAMTLDGKIATMTNDSRWITGLAARRQAQRLRSAYDAVAVGATTVLKDDPELTARDGRGRHLARQPLRIVVDGRLRVTAAARCLDSGLPGTALVVTSARSSAARRAALTSRGVQVQVFEGDTVDFARLLEFLYGLGHNSLLVEGGGELSWTAVRSGDVDRVYAFVGPAMTGGAGAPTPVGGAGYGKLAEALRLDIVGTRRMGQDLVIDAVPA